MQSLVIPSFIAGLLTFLAPCTLPLVPGYLAFISGVSLDQLRDPEQAQTTRRKIFLNGALYVVGFSVVFILLGSLFGLGGAALIKYRLWLSRIGGAFIIFFGLYVLGLFRLRWLRFMAGEKRFHPSRHLKPGTPVSSLIFGATFAFGWTPCIGPILGSVLFLASTSATVGQGAFLLLIFSLGLAVPFLIIAATTGWAATHLRKIGKYLTVLNIIGGTFLVFIGILLLLNDFGVWISWFYKAFSFLNYEKLLTNL